MYEMVYELDSYDFLEEEDDSIYNYDDVDDVQQSENLEVFDILKYCVQPTVLDVYTKLLQLFVACLLFRILTVLNLPEYIYHVASSVLGSYMLYLYFESHFVQIIVMAGISYLLLLGVSQKYSNNKGFLVGIPLLAIMVVCELYLMEQEHWQKVRGAQMILVMKVISVAFDLDAQLITQPNVLQYFGYLLCVGTCVFGPWVSYNEYRGAIKSSSWSFNWILKAGKSGILSMLFFTMSVCWVDWFIPASSGQGWSTYRDALLFRAGHYFVSYVSETAAVTSGFHSELTVSRPILIEFPNSLVQVVVFWNMPMHKWLKNYIFRPTRRSGNFVAVMSTYLVSSLLHGLNYRLAGVLLSLGLYTWVEHTFRYKLSQRFDACLSAKPCPLPCPHHYRNTSNLIVNSINLCFTALAMFHLAYLGVLIDVSNTLPSTFPESFDQWANLNFISHWVVLFMYLLQLFL